MDCIFCKIIAGEIPSTKVYEDEKVYAFKDINPMAPVHILVIPKEHLSSADDINEGNSAVIARIFEKIPEDELNKMITELIPVVLVDLLVDQIKLTLTNYYHYSTATITEMTEQRIKSLLNMY